MSDSMTCSLTPPLSPYEPVHQEMDGVEDEDSPRVNLYIQDSEEGVEVPRAKNPLCFRCQGEVFPRRNVDLYHHIQFSENSFIKSGIMDRLTKSETEARPEATVDLFGYTFPYMALGDRMDKLFQFARQTIGEIQNSNEQDGRHSFLSKRQNLVGFLEYVHTFINRSLPSEENERRKFLRSLLRQLQLMLVHCGRLSEDAGTAKYTLNRLDSVHHSFHHRLEVSWHVLVILHSLTTASCAPELPLDTRWCHPSGAEDETKSVFDQLLTILLCDLVSLAGVIFEKLAVHEWLHVSPFACTCVMEVWVLLIQLLRHRKETYDTESFWVQLHQILQTLGNSDNSDLDKEHDSDVQELRVWPVPSRPVCFSLWITCHLAHLCTFQHDGTVTSPDATQNCFFAIQMMMEKIMKTSVKEDALRACLRCCLSVSTLWPPSSQLLTLLWEHFSRKLDDRFQLHSASIEGLAVINNSATSLLERCRHFFDADDTGVDHETSYYLYLRLLARLLRRGGGAVEWRQIKGRFLSKFHQRRMQDLKETGLHNMSCLFLTVTLCVDAEEVARQVLSLYDMVDPTAAYGRLRAQVWRGALALMQLLVTQGNSCGFLAEKLACSFNSMAKQLCGSVMDYSQKQDLAGLNTLYIDGVRDIVEHSRLEGAEHLLIDEGLDLVLRSCGDSQMRHMLTALDSIIVRLRCLAVGQKQGQGHMKDNHCPGHAAFVGRLWRHVFPFIRDHAMTLTPPLSLADLGISFVHLAVDFPTLCHEVCPGGVVGVIRQFAVSESTHVSITCHFLNQVLGDDALRPVVVAFPASPATEAGAPSPRVPAPTRPPVNGPGPAPRAVGALSQTEVVKSWWRCVLLMPSSSASLSELTRHVLALPDLGWLMLGWEAGTEEGIGFSVGWKRFVERVGSHFRHAQNLLEKQKVRQQVMPYFADTVQQVSAVVRSSGPPDALLNVYRVLGHLVQHCAPILYMQSKPCPLPEIIKILVLPASVFTSDRPLHPNVLSSVRDTLHLFLDGLGCLDYLRDSFVQRQVGNIVLHFLPRFPQTPLDVYGHPVLRLLGHLPHEKVFSSADFHRFLSNLVVENLRKSSHPNSTDVLAILNRC